MKNKLLLLFVIIFFSVCNANAQATFPVTDSTPVVVSGLMMGYHIKSTEEKQVGDKGNFSRYNVLFYITNTTPEAKIILYKQGWNALNNISDYLVRFDCANATGARLTSKSVTLEAAPCNVLAQVDDKDASGKTIQNKRFVQIGYWIKPGETISASTIMIVPLNEFPQMTATFLMNSAGSMASGMPGINMNTAQNIPAPQGFFKLRNLWKNTFINNQQGQIGCTTIDNEWWSAQWQLIPVPASNFFLIQNRWKNNFISLDPSGFVTMTTNHVNTSMWQIEPVAGSDAVRFKNAANNTYLNIEQGNIQSTAIWNSALSSEWIMEQQ
jgi:hypothetical protein